MARNLKIQEVKELAEGLKAIPLPLDYDIKKARLAALTCNSDKEFMEFMEISNLVFRYWCKHSKPFKDAYESWKELATDKVERALAKKAIGFTKITKREVVTKNGELITLNNETYYPPDTAAAQFWLKNRKPAEWKDTSQVDVNVNANIRAWLVSAMGEGDDSELIDVGPGSLIEGEMMGQEPSQLASEAETNQRPGKPSQPSPWPYNSPLVGSLPSPSLGQPEALREPESEIVLEASVASPEPHTAAGEAVQAETRSPWAKVAKPVQGPSAGSPRGEGDLFQQD